MPTHTDPHNFYTELYCGARSSSVKRGHAFDLTREQFNALVERAQGCCMVTGIPFVFDKHPTATRRPFAPSLDRIDNARGYAADNVRLVCLLVNFAMNEWGIGPLRQVAETLASGVILPTPAPAPEVHYEHVWRNVTYMTMHDYLRSKGSDKHADYQTCQKMMAYCRRAGVAYINTFVGSDYRGTSYLAFPLDILELFC